MTAERERVVIIQTAFLGDVVLTLPLIQRAAATADVAAVVIPATANLLEQHPAVKEIIVYDKKGRDRGIAGMWRIIGELRDRGFAAALVPHRSFRSAAIAFLARIPVRIGFSTSTGRWLMTRLVTYDPRAHEIFRNLSLLSAWRGTSESLTLPIVRPTTIDEKTVDEFLILARMRRDVIEGRMVAIAPGSVWFTKRWPEEHVIQCVSLLVRRKYHPVLIGGKDDADLCGRIRNAVGAAHVVDASGRLTVRQSAELIRRARVLISNDSAPMHLAVGVGTPVIALYGATVPEFGFRPKGLYDQVIETHGLACRPCGIHGGDVCPIGTFECMRRIDPEHVVAVMEKLLARLPQNVPAPR